MPKRFSRRRRPYRRGRRRNYRRARRGITKGYKTRKGGRRGAVIPWVRRFVVTSTIEGTSTFSTHLSTSIEPATHISGWSSFKDVFNQYRILKAKVTTSIGFSGSDDNSAYLGGQLYQMYFRKQRTFDDTLGTANYDTENKLLEDGAISRRTFSDRGNITQTFRPHTWKVGTISAAGGSAQSYDTKQYRQWFNMSRADDPTDQVRHSGMVVKLNGKNGQAFPSGMRISQYYTVYGQFKTLI